MVVQQFKDRLISARESAGISQTRLGDMSGMASTQISRYESGRAVPRRQVIQRLAFALGVSYDWLSAGLGPEARTENVDQQIVLPVELKETLQQIAENAGRTISAEVVARLEQSLGLPALRNSQAVADEWDRLRLLRARASALAAEVEVLERMKVEMTAVLPKDPTGTADIEAQRKLWDVHARIYDVREEAYQTERALDELYATLAYSAPGAGRLMRED